ncbi:MULTISPECIES: hemagglutinin repeat-containing protein [unclassified Guyparkeria]|uniref:hemagglutinin repeat-containing protein n=1 Tax=unclassified Guyparkeria TaxID=2626246 RepID=UPI0007333E99|nr:MULTISPECIES: hemagglutinin repeat-containing protein [unclassified Guyparkeria]KTG17131.1 hypothetical protein AUR63_10320 [Guyparkeria sp. XI15]OAE86666.1 hypothetical protein AWR35_10335 [Guyparkeria sp. WRN-7]
MLAMLVAPTLAASDIRSHPEARGEHRPTIHRSDAGTAVVDITTPAPDGVSHNVYEQLDVDAAGVVFNNGRETSATTLAGQVGANPALAGGTADLILNEVRATKPSQLAGYLEIGGDPADLVIANPAGITCNGCGFINAERAMLTTGKPRFADGQWNGLEVRGGRIRIEGDGMDASRTAQADLLARVVEINAGIWADEINVTTGVGQFDPKGQLVESLASDSSPAEWSIDTALLGGMYANKIRLVANENGVGVRNQGSVHAGSAGLALTAEGQLVNQGSLHSESRARVNATSIDNRGTLQAIDRLRVTSAGALANHDGDIGSQADLTLSASSIDNGGTLQAGEDITLFSDGRLNNHQGQILAERDVTLTAERLDNRGEIHANGTLEIQAASTLSNHSILTAVDSMHLSASDFLNRGELRTGNDLHLMLDADLDNTMGRIQSGGEATVSASSFDNRGGQLLAGQVANVQAGQIDNDDGLLFGTHGLSLVTDSMAGDGQWLSQGDIEATIHGSYRHEGETIAGGNLLLSADGQLINDGRMSAASSTIDAVSVENRSGSEITADQLDLATGNRLDNRGLIDGGQVSLTATDVVNRPDARLYGTRLSVTATTLRNLGDDTQAASLAAREQMRLAIDELENRNGALILSAGDMSITGRQGAPASHLFNQGATIEALGALTIEAERIENRNGGLVTAQVDEAPVQESWIQLRGSQRTFDAATCSNLYDENVYCQGYPHEISDFTWFRATAVTSHTEVIKTDPATIRSGDDMTLVGDKLVNTDSQIIAGDALRANLGELDNQATQGQDITRRSGTASFTTVESCGFLGSDHCREWHGTTAYDPAPLYSAPYDLPTVTYIDRVGAKSSPHTLPSLSEGGQAPLPELTQASLFRLRLDTPGAPLVATDPRFAGYRQWYGSQAMLDALARDPAYTQKRLGDAFYEQALVREQVVERTGQRHLNGFNDDDAQFRALIDAGIAYGRDLEIAPGVRLSEKQLDKLTTDIVWLEESTVRIDGETQRVLVPTLHLADDNEGAVSSHGLLAARDIKLAIGETFTNRGRLQASDVLKLTAERIETVGGSLRANRVNLAAASDIHQRGGEVVADSVLSMAAGRDITIQANTRHDERGSGTSRFTRDQIVDAGQLAVAGSRGALDVAAGRDLTLQATKVAHDGNGTTRLSAGRDLRLTTATEGETERLAWNADNHLSQGQSRERGTTIDTRDNLVLTAGEDIAIHAGKVDSRSGHVSMTAGNDIRLASGRLTRRWEEAHRIEDDGLVSGSVSSSFDSRTVERHIASSVGADRVTLTAGEDVTVRASRVISDSGTRVEAGGDIQLLAKRDRQTRRHFHEKSRSGLFSNGGLSVTLGHQRVSRADESMQQTASPTQLASIDGDVNVRAGETYRQTGSDLLAPAGDVDIHAGRVEINEARETARSRHEHEMEQSGVTLALTSPVIDAAQDIQRITRAADDTDSGRMKRLAAAGAGLAGMDAYSHIKTGRAVEDANLADQAGGVSVTVSMGTSENRYFAESRADTARGSRITAGGNVRIEATGRDRQSDIVVRGSDIRAEGNASLSADDDIKLLAAESRRDEKSENDSRSASLGIDVNLGTGGAGFSATASAARGEGETRASKRSHRLTHIAAGQNARLQSGHDTALVGAVVTGQQVQSDVGGELRIASAQDESDYLADQQNQSIGASIPIGGWDISGSYSREESEARGNYRSVTEQSAIRAGNGGFDLDVAGTTDLVGSVIASTADPQQNRLTTGTLTTRDLKNTASAYAKASGTSLSSDMVTQGRYGLAKALLANTSRDAHHSSESNAYTRSAIEEGLLIVADKQAQESRAGISADETASSLLHQTENTHVAATPQDAKAMHEAAKANSELKNLFYEQATNAIGDRVYASDDAEKKAALQKACDESQRGCEPEIVTDLSNHDFAHDEDGAVYLFNHGIFNSKEEALRNAVKQHGEAALDTGIYTIMNPETSNMLAESAYASLDKIRAFTGWTWLFGASNSSHANVDIREAVERHNERAARTGEQLLHIVEINHSRGSLTASNATRLQEAAGETSTPVRSVLFNGAAANAQRMADRIDTVTRGMGEVRQNTHQSDLIGIIFGANPPSGGKPAALGDAHGAYFKDLPPKFLTDGSESPMRRQTDRVWGAGQIGQPILVYPSSSRDD